ncbi:PP2C family protein-serine/threonine phosphatase [Pseudoduganella sp. OTU4001]|uniref:PP2C family protein-serine/threonine phosphatase n=1 Tax=Pseudoduganella sp. OTU4001 TaxID=3043854 RepID=UPI00313C7F3B
MADMSQRLALNVAEVSSVGGRSSNQDAIGRAERGELACFVVSDGAGGHEGGEVAARTVVQSVLSTFGEKPGFSADATPAMVAEAAIAVARSKKQRPALQGMSATVALALVDRAGAQATWAHMGDTRIYLFRAGRLLQATRDHSMVQQMIDSGLAAGADPRSHPKRNVLYAAIGTDNEVQPAVQPPLALLAGDAILICTDGLWEWVAEPQMEMLLAQSGTAQQWLDAICAVAEERSGLVHKARDNFSAQAIFIGEAP